MPALGWVVHSLGGVDLTFEGPSSTYFVENTAQPPEVRIEERLVPLNDGSSGARLATYNEGEAPHSLDIIGLGDTVAQADAALAALQTQCDSAMNGSDVVYEYQLDSSQPEPTSWRVVRGKMRERWRTAEENAQIFALAGKATSLGKLELVLSKN